jgi:purine nucleosidase
VQARIEALGTPLSFFVGGLMNFFRKTYQDNQDFVDPPVHDPCTIAYLIDPTVVQTRRCPVDIELRGALTLGMTVADLRGPEPSAEECHTQVATKLDFDKFWDLVVDAIKRIG